MNIECPGCRMNYVEVDETKNVDGTQSIQRCKMCKYDIKIGQDF